MNCTDSIEGARDLTWLQMAATGGLIVWAIALCLVLRLHISSRIAIAATRAALQLAVKEKVDLDAAKAEIKNLKKKMASKSTAAAAGAKAPQHQQGHALHDTSRQAAGKAARKAARKPQQLRMVHATSRRSKVAADPFKRALKHFLGEASLVVRPKP